MFGRRWTMEITEDEWRSAKPLYLSHLARMEGAHASAQLSTRQGIFCTLGRKSTAKSLQTLPSPSQTQTRVPRSISNGCRSTRAMAMPPRGQRHGDALALRGRVTHEGCDCFDKASSPPLARSDPAIEQTPCHGEGARA
jgi:hypothetical protein